MTRRAHRGQLSEVLWQALGGSLFLGPTLEACDVLLFGEVWGWGEAVARSVLFAVLMAVSSAVAVRFSATSRGRADVGRVVSTGVLPEDADGEWRGRLTAEQRRPQSGRRAVPSLSGLAAVLVASRRCRRGRAVGAGSSPRAWPWPVAC